MAKSKGHTIQCPKVMDTQYNGQRTRKHKTDTQYNGQKKKDTQYNGQRKKDT